MPKIDSDRLKILDDAEKKHQEMLTLSECLLSANLYTTFSAHCIDLYKDFEITNKNHTRQRTLYNSYLKIAKSLSDRGYMAAKKLEQLKPKLTDKDRETIASCINNELFYSATAIIDEEDKLDKNEISRLYTELEKIYNDNESIDKTSMMETMTWAKLNAGWYTNLSEIEKIIQPLLNNKRYPYELRKDIFERYKKYCTPQGYKLKLNEPPKDY